MINNRVTKAKKKKSPYPVDCVLGIGLQLTRLGITEGYMIHTLEEFIAPTKVGEQKV